MVLISFTNVVVDEFSYGKRHPMKRYIYFLTHMHSDHYQGISAGWNYGTIYCSDVTKKLLLNKFPLLPDVRVLEMNSPNKICLHAENKIEIVAYAFDANHCPGSVMFMFEGYFGRILHTGDMRFNENLILNNPILYPPNLRNAELKRCSLQIDECIFDNTYCDPIFHFPKRERACQMLVEIIEKHKDIPNVRFLICVDSVGKEELLVFLSQRFETLIVVNEQRYQSILCMDIPHQLFTTQRDSGWIEVIRKGEKQERLASKMDYCISITCTGWANISGYISKDNRDYLLPYSLHSNFEELELFVRSIYPSVLNTVVRNTAKGEKINNISQFSAFMITLMNLKQRGVEFFKKSYVDFQTVSKEYASLMTNAENITKINCALGLELTAADRMAEDSIDFQQKYSNIFKNKQRFKNNSKVTKGAKLSVPSENSSFSIDKFMEIKQSVEEMKEMRRQSSESISSKVSEDKQRQNSKRMDFYDPCNDRVSRSCVSQDESYSHMESQTREPVDDNDSSEGEECDKEEEQTQLKETFRKPIRIVRKQENPTDQKLVNRNNLEQNHDENTEVDQSKKDFNLRKEQLFENPESEKNEGSEYSQISDFDCGKDGDSLMNSKPKKKKHIVIKFKSKQSFDEFEELNEMTIRRESLAQKQSERQDGIEKQLEKTNELKYNSIEPESLEASNKNDQAVSIFKNAAMNKILGQFISKS